MYINNHDYVYLYLNDLTIMLIIFFRISERKMKTQSRLSCVISSKIFTFLILFVLTCSTIYSQSNSSTYSLSGYVADSETGNGLEGVNIIFTSRRDSSFIGGVTTDSTGYFSSDKITERNVRIRFSMIGYRTKVVDSLSLESTSRIGVVKMEAGSIDMPEVVVKSIKPMIEFHADKHVVNVDQVPGNTGSLTEVLNNSGEVQVDPTTNAITVRGEAVKIQMDGHNFNMPNDMLTQMPASTIDQIEVILSPSAKESAEGGIYIINLISKKSILDNLNASINLNTSTNNRNYGGINFNYKNGKLNVFSALFGYFGEYKWFSNNEQVNYNSSSLFQQLSTGEGSGKGNNFYWKFGFDYDISETDLITFYGTYSRYKSDNTNHNFTGIFDSTDLQTYNYDNLNEGYHKYSNLSYYAFYRKKFAEKGHEITFDGMYTLMQNPSETDKNLTYSNKPKELHNDNVNNNSKTLILKVDYKYPTEIGNFETGYNFTYRNRENDLKSLDFTELTGGWFDDMNLSNYFKYKEEIHAYYVTYDNRFGDLGIKTGIRIENLLTKGEQITTNENFTKNYLSVFPNLNISYKFNDTFQLTLNIFRRVRYPQLYYVNPFKRYMGPNSYSVGNPELEPYFLNSFGLDLSQYINVYYVFSNGLYYSANSVIDDSVSVQKYVNLNSNKTYGIDLTLPYYNSPNMIFKLPGFISMLRLQYSYNYREQTGNYMNDNLSYSGNYHYLRASIGFNLWYGINAHISYRYNPEISTVRFKRQSDSYLSVYLSKSFLENKLRVNLSVSDLLNTQRRESETFGTNFYSKSVWEMYRSRSVSIGITYLFNNYRERRDRNIDDGRDGRESDNF